MGLGVAYNAQIQKHIAKKKGDNDYLYAGEHRGDDWGANIANPGTVGYIYDYESFLLVQ